MCLCQISITPIFVYSPKCYCTKTCPMPLDELKQNCTSGQLHPDQCNTCLQCAKSRGQECGGLFNRLGVCGVGLRCLVRYNVPKGSNGRLQENNSAGECVSEDSKSCPGKQWVLITKIVIWGNFFSGENKLTIYKEWLLTFFFFKYFQGQRLNISRGESIVDLEGQELLQVNDST